MAPATRPGNNALALAHATAFRLVSGLADPKEPPGRVATVGLAVLGVLAGAAAAAAVVAAKAGKLNFTRSTS